MYGQAPTQPGVLPSITYAPLFSRIRPGETRRRAISIALPVDEYSSLERETDALTTIEEVARVFFVLGVRCRSTMNADPVPPLEETDGPDARGAAVGVEALGDAASEARGTARPRSTTVVVPKNVMS